MWMASILQILALGAVAPAAPLAAPAAPAPIYWRQSLFSIPFHVDRPERVAQEPVEVQLYVSGDKGVRWDNWRQAPPQKGYFLFRAGTDGEYWFDVRTLDRSGQVRPQGPHAPKLVVIVDTLPPKAQLAARRGDAGQVTAVFRIEELHPNLDSLAIEYRLGPTAAWQMVPVGRKDVRSNNAEHTGEGTWYPQSAAGTMEIRLRISDMAGNPAESHTQVVLLAATANFMRPPSVPFVGPPFDESAATANPMRPPWGATAATPAGTNPLGPRPATTAVAGNVAEGVPYSPAPPATTPSPGVAAKAADPWQPLGPPTGRTPWPAENAGTATFNPAPGYPHSGSATDEKKLQDDAGNGSVALRVNPPVTHQFVENQTPASPPPPVNPFTGFTASRPAGPAAILTAARNVGPPPGVQLRWINTRGFELTFDTRAMGGMANIPVELWGTRDGGKSWQSFGKDPRGQSPMLVTVPEDGIYGFRMAIQNGPGMEGRPPLPGEVPGIWIGIDMTRPVGRITRAQQGVGPDGGKLFIEWEASDDRALAARPIALSYSERLGGPWTTMAGDLQNTGRYAWQLTGSLPQRMYLRLEMHDAAGNMGIYETPQPVTLDLSSPAAQLRDLRPLGQRDPQPVERTNLR